MKCIDKKTYWMLEESEGKDFLSTQDGETLEAPDAESIINDHNKLVDDFNELLKERNELAAFASLIFDAQEKRNSDRPYSNIWDDAKEVIDA